MKKLLAVIFACFIAVLLCSAVFYTAVLTAVGSYFTLSNATRGADAIVVLSGGVTTRLPRAYELYRQGYAPRIFLTEGRTSHSRFKDIICDERDNAMALIDFWGIREVVEVAPSLKGGATSTFDEAYDLLDVCRKKNFKHIIIVTDNHHTRRALYAFTKIFSGTDIHVEAAGAVNALFHQDNWWRSDAGISAYVMEIVKYSVYRFSIRNAPFVRNY